MPRLGEPAWWYETGPHWQAMLLSPIGALVGKVAAARLRKANPYRSKFPVICVGNFTAGGSGKTPLAVFLAGLVSKQNLEPWFLSRGYGGNIADPTRVDPTRHTAAAVGDEPLLLAKHAPAVISRDRRKGAELIESLASRNAAIIMDDGLQNPSLAKDLTIAVVDVVRGFGNGLVIPAGPLRAPIRDQVELADVIILIGRAAYSGQRLRDSLQGLTKSQIIIAETRPTIDATKLRGTKVLAYAGIANPQRFFATLKSLGAVLSQSRAFPDHHVFTENEARSLLTEARSESATLVTTEKDVARLAGTTGICAELLVNSHALAIEIVVEGCDLVALTELIRNKLTPGRAD